MTSLFDEYVEHAAKESELKSRLNIGGFSYLPVELQPTAQWATKGSSDEVFWIDYSEHTFLENILMENYYSVQAQQRFSAEDTVSFVVHTHSGEKRIMVFRAELEQK